MFFSPYKNENLIATIFYIFLLTHLLVWTLVPILVRCNLPLDTIENITWGHQLQWGYDKNPFLGAWLAAFAIFLSKTGWTTYLFAQLSIMLCFWSVWSLGKKILSPLYALFAVLFLEGIQYYNIHAIELTDNTLEIGLWSLSTLFFYRLVTQKRIIDGVLTGFFASLATMTKYYSLLLIISFLIFIIVEKEARNLFKKPALYYGLLTFLAIIFPHLLWLIKNHAVTIHYAFARMSSASSYWNPIFYPAKFSYEQAMTLLPAIFLFVFLIFPHYKNEEKFELTTLNKSFLICVGFGPFFLTLLISLLSGITLRAAWGQPLFSLWGLFLLAYFKPGITPEKIKKFSVAFLSVFLISVIGYAVALMQARAPSTALYPGEEIAAELTHEWHSLFQQPLLFVGGSRWLSGNISFYSKDHPAVNINWDRQISPWINEEALKKAGAIFVWDEKDLPHTTWQELRLKYKNLGPIQTKTFSWKRAKNLPPITFKIAFLPPSK